MIYDADMVGIASQIAYGGYKKFVTPFHQGGAMPAI
jgi:trimethylamine:corrinoid methyltransferase-like protein